MNREEKRMAIFIIALAVSVAIYALIEFLYAELSPFGAPDRVEDWDRKKGRYGIDYRNTKKD